MLFGMHFKFLSLCTFGTIFVFHQYISFFDAADFTMFYFRYFSQDIKPNQIALSIRILDAAASSSVRLILVLQLLISLLTSSRTYSTYMHIQLYIYIGRYEQSLSVLKHAKLHKDRMVTKSSIMLGLGESDEEVKEAMTDLRAIGVDILTLGQYLQVWGNATDLWNMSYLFLFFICIMDTENFCSQHRST